MQIIYFYQYFGTPKGGWSTRVYELSKRWVQKGHKVTVVTSIYDKSDLKATGLVSRQKIEGIDVLVLNVKLSNKHGFLYRLYTFLMYAFLSTWFALTRKYDVAIASSGPITVGIPGLVAKYLRNKPMVFEVRDLWPEGAVQLGLLKNNRVKKLAYWFEAKCYQAADAIVALSEGMADSIRERFNFQQKVFVIPNASDNALFGNKVEGFKYPDWAKDKKIFIYTGTLGLMDNCTQIIDAAKILSDKGINSLGIVMLGDGKERKILEDQAREYNLTNVTFLGMKPKNEVVGWLQNATAAFVVFKNVEVLNTCSPNKMFDAFAAGVPVIQTTTGWIRELIEKENCGINVPPSNAEKMASAIEEISQNEELRVKLAENAKKVALEFFDRDKLANEMLDILIKTSRKDN